MKIDKKYIYELINIIPIDLKENRLYSTNEVLEKFNRFKKIFNILIKNKNNDKSTM